MRPTTTKASERIVLSVREVASTLGVCQQTVRALIGRGELRAIRVGRSVRIPAAAVARLVGQK
jgi:excisionase family DNA binding protein